MPLIICPQRRHLQFVIPFSNTSRQQCRDRRKTCETGWSRNRFWRREADASNIT